MYPNVHLVLHTLRDTIREGHDKLITGIVAEHFSLILCDNAVYPDIKDPSAYRFKVKKVTPFG